MYKIFILILASFIFSQSILHIPIEEATEQSPILVEAFIDLPDHQIKKVSLFFRSKGDIKYIEAPMFKIDVQYLGEIPANFVDLNGNGLPEPTKLIGIRIFFLANKDSGIRSEAFVDHVIFTENETYKP